MERTRFQTRPEPEATLPGTKDGSGAGDHDEAFRFGYRPSVRWTYPFSVSQNSHLLILRGRVQDGDFAADMGDGAAA
jgi:hypothetical protein